MPDIRYWCNTCKKVIEPIEVEGHPHELAEWGGQGRTVKREKPAFKKKLKEPRTKIALHHPDQMNHIFTAIEKEWHQEMNRLRKAYEWSWPGLHLRVQSGTQRVSGGEQPDPTGNTAANRNREDMRLALEALAGIKKRISDIVFDVESAGGRWVASEGAQIGGVAPSLIKPKDYREAQAAQSRRIQRGEEVG